ncbi:unnamed protein product [Fusarium fujikuroi]|nr:unnamed protein product [Fusarium fujikuroi]
MSPIVRDAILTCEGKTYIADCDVERQKMNDIFRNAYLSTNNQSREFAIIPYEVKAIAPSFMFTLEFTDSKWYSRAWVGQEVNFSARLVILRLTFVFFRYLEILICKNGARNETAIVQKGLREYHSKQYQDAQPFAFFRTCIESISTMDITFESDRLAAIAGVAKQVSQAAGSKYTAGLWAEDIYKILTVAFSSCLYELRSEIRNLYLLMVYPAEKEGEYYRVGSFEAQSAADDDNDENTGVLMEDKWEESGIVII